MAAIPRVVIFKPFAVTSGAQPITADRWQVLPNYNSDGSPNGFSYAGYKDVTSLVRTFSAKAPDPATNHPGNGTYTAGDVLGDTGNHWSYAAWSLMIISTSAETQGHQLYLITWASGLLESGDISAQIDLPTQTDSWNLVYIILSFRSETTTGGALSYLIW